MKTFDAQTGKIIDNAEMDFGAVNDVPVAPVNVPQIAKILGVPIGWVIIAGIVLLILPQLLKRRY